MFAPLTCRHLTHTLLLHCALKVIGAVRHKRASGEVDGEYKSLLGKVLRLHPDYYSMWNFRREAVLHEVCQYELHQYQGTLH